MMTVLPVCIVFTVIVYQLHTQISAKEAETLSIIDLPAMHMQVLPTQNSTHTYVGTSLQTFDHISV